MQLNGIDLVGYSPSGNVATFTVSADFDAVEALDGQELKVTEDGTDLAVFGGYRLLSLEREGEGRTRARFMLKLEANVEQAISAIQQNADIANRNINNATATANAANDSADRANRSAATANSLAEANAAAIEEIAATVFAE